MKPATKGAIAASVATAGLLTWAILTPTPTEPTPLVPPSQSPIITASAAPQPVVTATAAAPAPAAPPTAMAARMTAAPSQRAASLAVLPQQCTKVITVQAPLHQSSVAVVSDGQEREPISVTKAPDGAYEKWSIVVPAECEAAGRSFSVRFLPSGSGYSEVSGTITITETKRRAVRQ